MGSRKRKAATTAVAESAGEAKAAGKSEKVKLTLPGRPHGRTKMVEESEVAEHLEQGWHRG